MITKKNISVFQKHQKGIVGITSMDHEDTNQEIYIKHDDIKMGYQSLFVFEEVVFVQFSRFEEIMVYRKNNQICTIEKGYNIRHPKIYRSKLLVTNKPSRTWHIFDKDESKFTNSTFYVKCDFSYRDKFYDFGGVDQVSCFNIENQLLWKTDITSYGEWKTIDGTIEKNKREYNAFPCKDLILVPMKGRQLLALDAEDGSFRWMWTHDRGGKYGTDGSFLFNHDGLSLNRIDPSSGKLTHRIVHNDVLIGKDFYSASPVWVRSKYVILNETTTGKVAVFNKDNLALVKYFTFDGKIAHADSVVEAIEDTLYILDMDHNLRIIDLTK